jgi:uncharacterized protein YndB with AHSA1/START domain
VWEELDPILIQITIPLPPPMIFGALVETHHLEAWLCAHAEVEPKVGGRVHLTFEGELPFECQGQVTHLTKDVDFGYTWTGPAAFAPILLDGDRPTTSVYVRLQESPEGIDVTLEHIGWKSGEAWEEARSWHFHFWDEALQRLKQYILKVAYG